MGVRAVAGGLVERGDWGVRGFGGRIREGRKREEEREGNRNDMWAPHVNGSHIILV